ncbi:cold-shock protein [Cohnella zeiphila]|uniref:Cold-shock protein n=1 Tax=Cohnella zeiphila TaxID=2761120 RepID=A0A7X0ST19_9BACL|nr:cold-shock protein [Cohnella zeiphila]MBB6735582.1 cold-shock protein [Cohnella zeiphila]
MAYRSKPVEDLPHEDTKIWTCENKECNGWIRDDFAFADVPVCHLCHSPMISSVKNLPQIINPDKDIKSKSLGVRI